MVNTDTFPGITRFVASRVVGTPDGSPPPFYRVAEVHFPSMESFQAAASSAAAQKAVAHAVAIIEWRAAGCPCERRRDEDVLIARSGRHQGEE
jgi:hypothetical protein